MLHVGITYPRILLGLILTDFLLTFIVPSGIARVVIMASIALGLAEAFKSGVGSNVSRGMFLILSYTANIFDKMIIAGAGAITARGLIEKVGGVEVLWSYWFIAFLPCSIITVLAAWWLTLWLQVRRRHDFAIDDSRRVARWYRTLGPEGRPGLNGEEVKRVPPKRSRKASAVWASGKQKRTWNCSTSCRPRPRRIGMPHSRWKASNSRFWLRLPPGGNISSSRCGNSRSFLCPVTSPSRRLMRAVQAIGEVVGS
jgi:hypothetical protein